MSTSSPIFDREAQAKAEIGQTRISVAGSWALTLFMLVTIGVPPVVQLAHELRAMESWIDGPRVARIAEAPVVAWRAWRDAPGGMWGRGVAANRELRRALADWEDQIEDGNDLNRRFIRPWTQVVLTRWLGAEAGSVLPGMGDWLFYRPDVEHLTAPGFLEETWRASRRASGGPGGPGASVGDPVTAIRDMDRQLRDRGIRLIVLPTPVKPQIDPAMFAPAAYRLESPASAVVNASYRRFLEQLAAAGVTVYDPSDLLLAMQQLYESSAYLSNDTHWTAQSVGNVAQSLAQVIRAAGVLPDRASLGLTAGPVREVEHVGDLGAMLRLPDAQAHLQRQALRPVLRSDGTVYRPDPAGDVLLLGDSFSNIYSHPGLGWGDGAGLAEQLALALQRPVDAIIRNDGGALATRRALAHELARGRDRLAGKRVVVWQFAMRELSWGDWSCVPLELRAGPTATFASPPPGEVWEVRGMVAAVAAAPRPGSVPYRDHVVAAHVVDLRDEAGHIRGDNAQAHVFLQSMVDGRWTSAATLRPGQTVTLRLQSWADVAERYDRMNRRELDDPELQLQEPAWGVLLESSP